MALEENPTDLLLKGFPVVVEITVAWGEMDALKHVNNVVYFRYFENARIAYFEKVEILGAYAQNRNRADSCLNQMPVPGPLNLP